MKDISYLTDGYAEKIKRVNEIGAPLNFVFITDMHNRLNEYAARESGADTAYELAADHIQSIQYVLDRCPAISLVVSGGDVGNGYNCDTAGYKDSVREVYEELYKLTVPVHCIIGNHDDGIGNCFDLGFDARIHHITPDEMHTLCMKNNPTGQNYYFLDVAEDYRFVFLNSSDYPRPVDENGKLSFGWRLEISDRQAKWFETEALDTSRRVIVFSHAPLHNAGVMGTEGLPDLIKPYDDTLNAPRILRAIADHPNVVANICGHVHYDNVVYNSTYVTITTLCSFMQEWCATCPPRKAGTPTETAFDVFSIKDNVICVTRFGAGRDREAEIIVTPYLNR